MRTRRYFLLAAAAGLASMGAAARGLDRKPGRPRSPRPAHSAPERPEIRFETADAGIDFRYFNSADPATPGARMFEFTGGGVGVLDYDADGRSDLHFTQGCRWPPGRDEAGPLDRLYRNLGRRFEDVTGSVGVVEPGFSQGVACGDFDGDGFTDLYVANVGPNRLLRNNGDGTFADATEPGGLSDGPLAAAWTVSALVADLNADGLPDLFDVNYVDGRDVFERICDQDGVARVCPPTVFEGRPDRLLLNRGDGTFEDLSAVSGIDAADGTGLGVVAADFDGSGRLSLFVANDERPNHFYANVTAAPGDPPRFRERAAEAGLALDGDGHTQACMGVAAGDADGDGRLDLFVTNYVDESSTLYRQTEAGTFEDGTRGAGLVRPSRKRLGFGTQFIDADLDGREDLVVANGHVDDFTHKGYDYRMRPQFFRNLGGRFVERPAESLGAYFEEASLGRGLARLDWDGDGRDEFAVSRLDAPAVLTTNRSPGGRSLVARLVATRSAREAVGATVEVRIGDRRLVRKLTAGDGYAASNERKLVFGLGDADEADAVVVRWPGGSRQSFGGLTVGGTWLLIEGQPKALRLGGVAREAGSKRVAP